MTMGKIKILHDPEGVYTADSVYDADEILEDYCDCCTDKSLIDYLYRIPDESAINFICNAWLIDYEFV